MRKKIIKTLFVIFQVTMPGSLLAVNFKIIGLPANDQRTPIASITNVIKDDAGNELIDIDNTDSLESEIYQELIKTKQQENRPYIIARVVSSLTNDIFGVHYFDAHALNGWLFKKFINKVRELITYKNPANNMPIKELDYFTIDNVDDPAFTYKCSFNNLMHNQNYWIQYFENNQPITLSYNEKAQLGLNFLRGEEGKVQNTQMAIHYFNDVVNQQIDLSAATLANNAVGFIYLDGLGVPINYPRARKYFQQAVVNSHANPFQTAYAHTMLGLIYFDGLGVSSNYPRARKHFEQAIVNPNDNLSQTAYAKAMLGLISYKKNDLNTAYQYFSEVLANPNRNPRATAIARSTLGVMHLYGGGRIDRNYTTAHQYFVQVILSPNDDSNSTIVSYMQLGYIYFYGSGVQKNIETARLCFEHVTAENSANDNQIRIAQRMLNQIRRE